MLMISVNSCVQSKLLPISEVKVQEVSHECSTQWEASRAMFPKLNVFFTVYFFNTSFSGLCRMITVG